GPLLVVDFVEPGLGRVPAGGVVLKPPHPHERDLAELARIDDPLALDEMRPATLLRAGLDHALARFDGADQIIPLFERMGDGLFDVNVLVSRHGVQNHPRVPVVWSADDDGVNALVVEDRAIVAYLLHVLQAGVGHRAEQVRVVDVGDGDEFRVGLILMNRNQRLARTAADADRAYTD